MQIHSMRRSFYCALIAGAAGLAAAVASLAAGAGDAIQSQYQQDVQRCNSGQTHQDRATCLREAGAAREEARRNRLDNHQGANLEANAMARCKALPAAQQQDCMTQMSSPTRVQGSVESGGVLRETEIQVPAPATGGTYGTTPSMGTTPGGGGGMGGAVAPAPVK